MLHFRCDNLLVLIKFGSAAATGHGIIDICLFCGKTVERKLMAYKVSPGQHQHSDDLLNAVDDEVTSHLL